MDKPVAKPVYIVRQQPTRSQRATQAVTRLGTPSALLMILGLFLVYYALRGWDAKYGTFNGTFAGKGAIPSAKLAAAPASTTTNPAVRIA